MSTPVLTYFDFTGPAESTRWCFAYGHVEFVDRRLTMEQWVSTYKKLSPTGRVPMLEVGGETLVESHAILTYAARLAGLMPSSAEGLLEAEEVFGAMAAVKDIYAPCYEVEGFDQRMELAIQISSSEYIERCRVLEQTVNRLKSNRSAYYAAARAQDAPNSQADQVSPDAKSADAKTAAGTTCASPSAYAVEDCSFTYADVALACQVTDVLRMCPDLREAFAAANPTMWNITLKVTSHPRIAAFIERNNYRLQRKIVVTSLDTPRPNPVLMALTVGAVPYEYRVVASLSAASEDPAAIAAAAQADRDAVSIAGLACKEPRALLAYVARVSEMQPKCVMEQARVTAFLDLTKDLVDAVSRAKTAASAQTDAVVAEAPAAAAAAPTADDETDDKVEDEVEGETVGTTDDKTDAGTAAKKDATQAVPYCEKKSVYEMALEKMGVRGFLQSFEKFATPSIDFEGHLVGKKLTVADIYAAWAYQVLLDARVPDLLATAPLMTRTASMIHQIPEIVRLQVKSLAKPILTYFDVAGRAESVRLCYHAAGIAFEDRRVSREDWFATYKAVSPTRQAPYVEHDGQIMVESKALLMRAAMQAQFVPVTADSHVRAEMIHSIWSTRVFPLQAQLYSATPPDVTEVGQKLAPVFSVLETLVKETQSTDGYVLDGCVTWLDFFVTGELFGLYEMKLVDAAFLKSYPSLAKVTQVVLQFPGVKAYLEARKGDVRSFFEQN